MQRPKVGHENGFSGKNKIQGIWNVRKFGWKPMREEERFLKAFNW